LTADLPGDCRETSAKYFIGSVKKTEEQSNKDKPSEEANKSNEATGDEGSQRHKPSQEK
jgi:hypothetical protein